MREKILLGILVATVSACGGEQSAEERAAAERNVTSQVVQTNDTTAIDAATGEAANMAADVPFIPGIDEDDGENATSSDAPERASEERPRPRAAERADETEAANDESEPEGNAL